MCILFYCCEDNCGSGKFKLIMANNRDELYNRDTGDAEFWKDYPQVIGGVDLDPTRKAYGTWLGINKNGKFGVLTNYRQNQKLVDRSLKGRGSLVTDYLIGDENFHHYLEKLKENGKEYGFCNLLLGRVSVAGKTEASVYCNVECEDNEIKNLGSECIHVLSNRVLDYPWKKVVNGKKKFTEIVKTYQSKEHLIESLLEMLQDETRYYPGDPKFIGPHDAGVEEALLQACSAISVKLPIYGTRTNTIVLVDTEGHVTYVERTLRNPTDLNNHFWEVKVHEFDLTQNPGIQ